MLRIRGLQQLDPLEEEWALLGIEQRETLIGRDQCLALVECTRFDGGAIALVYRRRSIHAPQFTTPRED